MKRLHDVKVGDKLTVRRQYGMSRTLMLWSFPTVASVNKRWVTDSDGGKWTLDGFMWGVSGWERSNNMCEPYAPEHEVLAKEENRKIKMDRIRGYLRETAWRDIDDETVLAVYAMVKNTEKGAAK